MPRGKKIRNNIYLNENDDPWSSEKKEEEEKKEKKYKDKDSLFREYIEGKEEKEGEKNYTD